MLTLKNPLMFTTTHDRIVADDAKKLGEQSQLIAKLTAERDECKSTAGKVFAANLKLASENTKLTDRIAMMEGYNKQAALDEDSMLATIMELRGRLAVFTAPRPRGAGGKFLSTKGAQA